MLSTPSTHLIIISYGIDERLVGFLRQINLAQITLLCGSEFGSIDNLVQYYLPKAAIDTITESASKLVDARKGYLERAEVSLEVQNELYSDKCIGIVDSVSPFEIKGFLLDTAPTNVSITEGNISLFPRINSFLTIPNETGCLVGMISWIGYNHLNVNSEVNLPRGARIISLNILGHITATLNGLEFERGAFALPTVGDPILLPDPEQLDTIIENHDAESITIGTSPLAGNRDVRISVNELFGRHLAVLGNTGSGKSCTVSGLIRWSIESSEKIGQKSPNARFIILDPNGEYKHSFDNLNVDVTHCTVKDLDESSSVQLRIPAWM